MKKGLYMLRLLTSKTSKQGEDEGFSKLLMQRNEDSSEKKESSVTLKDLLTFYSGKI
jgi:hypothetical protein